MRDAILSLYDTGGSSTNWVLFDDLRRELILQINTVFTCANGDTNELVNRLTNHVIGHGKIAKDKKKRGKLGMF